MKLKRLVKDRWRSLPMKWRRSLKILPAVATIIIIKNFIYVGTFGIIFQGYDMGLLFPSIIGAEVFLFGFLVSGVLSDFKECEKLPGEISSSLELFFDETEAVLRRNGSFESKQCMENLMEVTSLIMAWFNKKEKTSTLFDSINGLNLSISLLEPFSSPIYVCRMKEAQNNLREAIIRADTIRETSFINSAYALAQILTVLLIVGLFIFDLAAVGSKESADVMESLFLTGIIAYISLFMLDLIRDLDNPFDYLEGHPMGEEVSLKPIEDTERRMREKFKNTANMQNLAIITSNETTLDPYEGSAYAGRIKI